MVSVWCPSLAGLLCEVADSAGLTAGLTALSGGRKRRHAPGVTVVRAAAAIAAGQRNVSGVSLFCGSRPAIFEDPAAGTYKGGFGYNPLVAWLDETRKPLAMMLRPGNAGSNTAVDHCDVIMRSIDQLPAAYQAGHQPGDDAALVAHPVRVRADSAGAATKPFLADLDD